MQPVPAVVLRCLRLYQLPARSVLLFLYRGCFFGKLLRGCFCFGLFGSFLCGMRLFGGLFLILCLLVSAKCPSMVSISFAAVLRIVSREPFNSASSFPLLHPAIYQKNSPTYQARNVGRQHRRRFPPVPRGCGGRGVPARLCLCHGCRMGDFMDCGLDILQFVHALVDEDTLFLIIAASFYAAA